jgi:hypothetical protein
VGRKSNTLYRPGYLKYGQHSEADVDVRAWTVCHTLQLGGVSWTHTRKCTMALERCTRACTRATRDVRFGAASCYSGPSEAAQALLRPCGVEGAQDVHAVTLQRGQGHGRLLG